MPKTNNRRVGNLNEEKVCWYYLHQGYRVWAVPWADARRHYASNQFRGNDVFNLFDLIAVNDKEVVFIQVKTAKYFRNELEEEIKGFLMPETAVKEYWAIRETGDAKVRRFIDDLTWEYEVDLVKMQDIYEPKLLKRESL